MNKFLKFWLPVVVWAGLIFVLSSIPSLKTNLEQDFLLRKIAHIVEFGILTFLLYRAISAQGLPAGKAGGSPCRAIIYSFIFALFYAFSDELHQYYVPGRHCSLKDVGIDSVGILIFSLACYYKNRKAPFPVGNSASRSGY
ncbi:MAG: VanZ family protein [Patescibacteria group bacterium]